MRLLNLHCVSSASSLCPVATVELSVGYGLSDVWQLYLLRAIKVGNGAGNLELPFL